MSQNYSDTFSEFIVPGYQTGYYDILLLSQNSYSETNFTIDINDFNPYYYMAIENLNASYTRNAEYESRLAGEGATPTTFQLQPFEVKLSFSMPLRVESNGYLNMTFDLLCNYCLNGNRGSKTSILGRYKSGAPTTPIAAGVTSIVVDNIADFLSMPLPFTAEILCDDNSETTETIVVSAVNKSTKTLTLSSATTQTHTPYKSYVIAYPELPVNTFPNTFSLLSLREGLFTDCLVDKISFTIKPGDVIVANFEIVALNLYRQGQIIARDNFNSVLSELKKRRPYYTLDGANFRINALSYTADTYGLGFADTNDFFQGFQGLDISNFMMNEVTLNISNNFKPAYTLHSKVDTNYFPDVKLNKQLLPMAYYSDGRKIDGEIKYTSSINPYALFEKLAGPVGINNGGISYDFGKFYIPFSEVIYSPGDTTATMDSNVSKNLRWAAMTGNLNFIPVFLPD